MLGSGVADSVFMSPDEKIVEVEILDPFYP